MSLLTKDRIESELASLVSYRGDALNIYFAGSMTSARQASFNPKLSDLDLLFVLNDNSIESYAGHFEQIIKVHKTLGQMDDQVVDVFAIAAHIQKLHLACLSVIAGQNQLQELDRAFGGKFKPSGHIMPSNEVRRKLYAAKANSFCQEYADMLPVADTTKARKVAKRLLVGAQLIICANTDAERLTDREQVLFAIKAFHEIAPLYKKAVGRELPSTTLLDRILSGDTVDDWPAWITIQDEMARVLMASHVVMPEEMDERRLYATLARLFTVLMIDLKEVLSRSSRTKLTEAIRDYVDTTASCIATLALAGVESLLDLGEDAHDEVIVESYERIVECLQRDDRYDLKSLAASVVLLTYAFEQGILEANRRHGRG